MAAWVLVVVDPQAALMVELVASLVVLRGPLTMKNEGPLEMVGREHQY